MATNNKQLSQEEKYQNHKQYHSCSTMFKQLPQHQQTVANNKGNSTPTKFQHQLTTDLSQLNLTSTYININYVKPKLTRITYQHHPTSTSMVSSIPSSPRPRSAPVSLGRSEPARSTRFKRERQRPAAPLRSTTWRDFSGDLSIWYKQGITIDISMIVQYNQGITINKTT